VPKAATVSIRSIYKLNNQHDQQHKSLTVVGRARIFKKLEAYTNRETMDDIKDDTMVDIEDDTKDDIKAESFTECTIQSYVNPKYVISLTVNGSAETRDIIVKEHDKCYI